MQTLFRRVAVFDAQRRIDYDVRDEAGLVVGRIVRHPQAAEG